MSTNAQRLVAQAANTAERTRTDVPTQVPGRGVFRSVKPGESSERRVNQVRVIAAMLRNDCPERKGGQ